jgi:hypothetical protein
MTRVCSAKMVHPEFQSTVDRVAARTYLPGGKCHPSRVTRAVEGVKGSNAPFFARGQVTHACGVDDVDYLPILSVDHFIRAQMDHFSQVPKSKGSAL